MRFVPSKDGRDRATVRVDFRAGREEVALAVALDAMESGIIPALRTKAEVAQIVRNRYALQGPPEGWTEYDDHDFHRAVEEAQSQVEELFGVEGVR